MSRDPRAVYHVTRDNYDGLEQAVTIAYAYECDPNATDTSASMTCDATAGYGKG